MDESRLVNRVETCLREIESEKRILRGAARNLAWWRQELKAAKRLLGQEPQGEFYEISQEVV